MRPLLLPVLLLAAACPGPGGKPDAGGPHDAGPSFSCQPGLTECGSACRDLSKDNSNCGRCGHICTAAYTCLDGQCTALCDTGLKYCSGACVNSLTDPMNCGGCGKQCPASTVCRTGACECPAPTLQRFCGDTCRNVGSDVNNCGDCGVTCDGGQSCSSSQCWETCTTGMTRCGPAPGVCHDLKTEDSDCGACGHACTGGLVCTNGNCVCPANQTACSGHCTVLLADPQNCGGCGNSCNGQPCFQGTCLSPCPAGQTRCGQLCVDLMTDVANCNTCGHPCTGATTCSGGACVACNSATDDCDHDGWLASQGDCCDTPGACAVTPAEVNPGAIELDNNSVDDNCNGLLDSADLLDLKACDTALAQGSADAGDYALAMELCRTTVEVPATPQQRTWGVISADLLRADGTPLQFPGAASVRGNYGVLTPQAGLRFGVFSTGLAADESQTNPGPNGGPISDPSDNHSMSFGGDMVDFSSCSNPLCIKDWFNASRPPLKLAMLLPEAPMCGGQTFSPNEANDSVMLRLRLRAPTNARAFQFSALFLSSEYPEFVCSAYNDQLIALIDTGARPAVSNPTDKNLMTYMKGGLPWPVGINVAAGTDLFARCKPMASDPCWDSEVDVQSCALGDGTLMGTGFGAPAGSMMCTTGGGTRWLTTSGNVVPGQIVELRIAIWDVDDDLLDSVVLLDAFRWLRAPAAAGTE